MKNRKLEKAFYLGWTTKQEAIAEMNAGKKVTHRYFTAEEFIFIKDEWYCDENGYHFAPNAFWMNRTLPEWEIDWLVFEGESN